MSTPNKQSKKYLDNLRHSAAHLLAAAALELYPNAKLTLGPPIEGGFYYDFDNLQLTTNDLQQLEEKMARIVKKWKSFEKIEVSPDEAKERYKDNEYKLELIDNIVKHGTTKTIDNKQLTIDKGSKVKGQRSKVKITIYQSGNFLDLCRGGHIDDPSKELKHFKLLNLAGAYWRGDEKNKMLTRIYGTAFPSKKGLDEYLKMREEAKKRDHRRLGKDLDLFSISRLTGQGLILWHPKLSVVRNIVEQFWKEEHHKHGYQLVFTPHIASMDMFVLSRHYNKYIDAMFPTMLHQYIEGESKSDYSADEQIKPMNCPNHIQIYKASPKSYRDLPVRLGELGTVYRYERAGSLHGMTRVRGFTQDDSHIFCRPDQVIDEMRGVIQLTKRIYDVFGFKDFQAYVSTRPKKHLGTVKVWNFAESCLKKALDAEKIDYKLDEGEGVFYGPKIDSKIKDSMGREWQLGTIQFDFNMPDKAEVTEEEIEEFWNMKTFKDKFKAKEHLTRYLKKLGRGFDVDYVTNKGAKDQVIMIHRTILGSMERFFGVLIEHYAGAFPVWLAPVQVKLLPVGEAHIEFANKLANEFKEQNIRVEVDDSSETVSNKIRKAAQEKIPYTLVLGDKEASSSDLMIRQRGQKDQFSLSKDKFIERVGEEVASKMVW